MDEEIDQTSNDAGGDGCHQEGEQGEEEELHVLFFDALNMARPDPPCQAPCATFPTGPWPGRLVRVYQC